MTSSIEEAEKLKVELAETYGEIPKVVNSLIDIALVRHLAGKIGAVEVSSFGATVSLVFEKNEDITGSELLANMIFKFRSSCRIDTISRPTIKFDREHLCSGNFELLKKFLLLAEDMCPKDDKN